MTLPFYRKLEHYASRIIDADTPVRLTQTGADVLSERQPLLLHPLTAGYLDPNVIRGALRALKPSYWLRIGMEVGDLVGVLRNTHNAGPQSALLHIMWLAKYDLVELGGAPRPLDAMDT